MKVLVITPVLVAVLAGCGNPKLPEKNSRNQSQGFGDQASHAGDSDNVEGDDDTNTVADDDSSSQTDTDAPPSGDESCTDYLGINDGCDCGCGEDPDCGGEGCSGPNCYATACDYCFNAQGDAVGCAPEEWTCQAYAYLDYYSCDCGCGIPDPDCGGGGCTEEGCDVPTCDECYSDGVWNTCASSVAPPEWTCSPYAYADRYYCDCGCGFPDPDCYDQGCTEPGCEVSACDSCADGQGGSVCPSDQPPEGWTCSPSYYSDTDCDCGCGIRDPTCDDTAGCTAEGCSESCDYCFADGDFIDCQPGDE